LRYQSNFAAGKNKIINGDFSINQRAFTSTTTSAAFGFDRFAQSSGGGTTTYSAQTFTPGAAPVLGYESQYFFRYNQSVAGTGGGYSLISTKMEDVRTLAGQTATLSFWIKADAARAVTLLLRQDFGSGGSSLVDTTITGTTATTGWVRYSVTFTVPSVSGKTIGTSSYLELIMFLPVNTVMTIDLWGFQMEASNTATAFQTATGTIQGELAACQRYYVRQSGASAGNAYAIFGAGSAPSTVIVDGVIIFPIRMRTTPTVAASGSVRAYDGVTWLTNSGVSFIDATEFSGALRLAVSGATQFRPYKIQVENSTTAYVEYSAEL
jgi:hypothetical protein